MRLEHTIGAVSDFVRTGEPETHRPVGNHDLQRYMTRQDWMRLPPAVRTRFGQHAIGACIDYYGNMQIVRRSLAGYLLAQLCRPFGAPVPPYAGVNVPTIVKLYESPCRSGIVWERQYRFPGRASVSIKSVKLYTDNDGLLEVVGGGIGMRLKVYEEDRKLNFKSQSFFWQWRDVRITLPDWLTPGSVHVIHTDEGNGWFRFTLNIFHPLLGELFFQDGLFRDED